MWFNKQVSKNCRISSRVVQRTDRMTRAQAKKHNDEQNCLPAIGINTSELGSVERNLSKSEEKIENACAQPSIDYSPNIVPYHSSANSAILLDSRNNVIEKITFSIGEIVWAKIRGFKTWPAKIRSFPSNKMAEVIWFNDYRRTKLYRSQLFKFLKHFDENSKYFSNTVGLETAAKEALFCYGQNVSQNQ